MKRSRDNNCIARRKAHRTGCGGWVRAIAGAGAMLAVFCALPLSALAATHEHGYTYNYDYWEDVQDSPDLYTASRVFTSTDLGLDTRLSAPQGLTAYGDRTLYLCDTGNNRVIELARESAEDLSVVRIIDSFRGGPGPNTFSGPTDIQVSEEGDFFIADPGNERILKLDADLNYLMEFVKPDDAAIDAKQSFLPQKIAIDTAGRVYCVAKGINRGLVKYEADGTFSGFVGATPVTFDWTDYIWKRLATQEQRAQMVSFVPTEYENLYMDYEGFIYAVIGNVQVEDLRSGQIDAIRKLNLMGNDILVRNAESDIIGDLYFGEGGGYTGPSNFTDVTVFDNDIYVCLDRNRGRLFGYDDQGRLVFAFGGNGNMDGYFRSPSGLEHLGFDLYVLDSLDNAITVFVPTEFGSLVYQAVDEFDQGRYAAAGATWERVMALNGNYDLAYIGIGRSLLRQERYREAMDYFELKYDAENYSKAYKQYRKEWVEAHIVWIVVIILALFLVPMGIGRVRKIRRDVETADIFGQ